MSESPRAAKLNHASLGFRIWRGTPRRMSQLHAHTDIELNLLRGGSVRYFFGGRFEALRLGELTVFWAGIPHQLISTAPKTEMIWVTIPLGWFMQWPINGSFRRRLLAGEFIRSNKPTDRDLMTGWARDFTDTGLRDVIPLEIEARVRRLAHRRPDASSAGQPAPAGLVEQVTRVIGEGYTEDLTVSSIAARVHRHPNYLMRVFKQQCGMSLWEYVLRLRVAHAQRLLATTDRKIIDIALSSGFGSAARFYKTFRRVCGCTPRAYRNGIESG